MDSKRIASRKRTTTETSIELSLGLDGTGQADIDTGIPFFDHMLQLFCRHGLFDLRLRAQGDLAVDYHHTVEDTGIVLGEAVRLALGDKTGIARYGFFLLPMDEALVRIALDLSNRPILVYRVDLAVHFVRDFNVGLVREFLQAFSSSAGANLHVHLEYGDEPHHVAEAVFKGLGRALRMACAPDPRAADRLPSTKGLL